MEEQPPVDGAGDKSHWLLSFNDTSFEDHLNVQEVGDESKAEFDESKNFDFARGLGDLSCSLLNCGDHDEAEVKVHVDYLESCVKNLTNTNSQLYKSLKNVIDKVQAAGDRESAVTAVEKELECLVKGLKQSNFLSTPKSNLGNVSSSTQTIGNEEIIQTTSVGTGVSPIPQIFATEDKEVECILNTSNDQIAMSDEEIDTYASPSTRSSHQVSYNVNPDSLRLTFSPSINEYESEVIHATCSSHDTSKQAASEIEDLKLQVLDVEKKLDSEKRFLAEMTLEREAEREEFQRALNTLALKYEELKRDKLKGDNLIEHQHLEINELEGLLQQKELESDELVRRCQTDEFELKLLSGKVCELREIIRGQEEQIESLTKYSASFYESKKENCDDIEEETDSKKNSYAAETHQDEDCSEFDHTEELQAQVDDLAKKIEVKLMELENFTWQNQNRPNSSCSAKSGDDVSVRATTVQTQPSDDSTAEARDLVAKVFCGLRRLECSFDGLVRFEEVLLKKMKDAELKVARDSKKIEVLKEENSQLRLDLTTRQQQIHNFQQFLIENKKPDSFSTQPSIERLRNTFTSFINYPELNNSPMGFRNLSKQGQAEIEDIGVQHLETSNREDIAAEFSSPLTEPEPKHSSSINNLVNKPAIEEKQPIFSAPRLSKIEPEKQENLGPENFEAVSIRKQESFQKENLENVANEKEENLEPENIENVAAEKSESEIPIEVEYPPQGLIIESTIELPEPEKEDAKTSKSSNEKITDEAVRFPSDETIPSNPPSVPEISKKSLSRSSVDKNQHQLATPDKLVNPEQFSAPKEEPKVLTYDVTTASDYEITGNGEVKYLGSQIIPNEDLDNIGPSVEAQKNRLELMEANLELEKLKTQIDLMQQALDAERARSSALENQLQQISQHPDFQSLPPSQCPCHQGDTSYVEQEISYLEATIVKNKKNSCLLKRSLDCAAKRISRLKQENDAYLAEIEQLRIDKEELYLQLDQLGTDMHRCEDRLGAYEEAAEVNYLDNDNFDECMYDDTFPPS